jgi:hypothetical protein
MIGVNYVDVESLLLVNLQISSWSKWLMKYCPVAVLFVTFEIWIWPPFNEPVSVVPPAMGRDSLFSSFFTVKLASEIS